MPRKYDDELTVVWLREERRFGTLVEMGAHVSLVRYSENGMDITEWMENDDFIVYENIIIKCEDDEK